MDNSKKMTFGQRAKETIKKGFTKTILWANPLFSKLPEVVTKACLEPTRMILVHPDWEDNYWSPLLNEITVHRAQIPSGIPVYLTERTKKPLPAPLWNTQVSLLDTTVKTIPEEQHPRNKRALQTANDCEHAGNSTF